jgi:predicted RNase H-like nuclease
MLAGVDGYKGGWVVAMSENWPCPAPPLIQVCRNFAGLLELTKACEVVAVDMPIGLPNNADRRLCDALAKEELGEGRNRVFFTPPRQTLLIQEYQSFLKVHREVTGKGNSRQTFCILPKLLQVDEVMNPKLQEKVFEFHPELAWKRLAGKVLESKSSPIGIDARVRVLKDYVPRLEYLVNHRPTRVKRDDLLDALIGLAVASGIREGANNKIPLIPPKDERGLRMEIWF